MFCRLGLIPYFCSVDITFKTDKMENTPKIKFEHLGFFLEYIVDGKFIGTKNVDENVSGKIGYESTTHFTAEEDIILKNKKIKKGTQYYTRTYPLCGRIINNELNK